jgi:hypothetical protein
MNIGFVARAVAGVTLVIAMPGMALAQGAWVPGSEIAGQPIQVTTNGTTNTIYFDQGGAARMVTPSGNTVPGTWQAANGQLCLSNGSAQECWPYNGPFQPGQPQTLTSSCNATSSWLAQSTNQPPSQGQKGERGQ